MKTNFKMGFFNARVIFQVLNAKERVWDRKYIKTGFPKSLNFKEEEGRGGGVDNL